MTSQPQPGREEDFRKFLPLAQEKLDAALSRMTEPPESEEEKNARASVVIAKCFCATALKPDHPPYDVGGVMFMLSIGKSLEEAVSSFQGEIKVTLEEALGYWKQAIINFPTSHRFSPAVTWAVQGQSPIAVYAAGSF